MDFEVINIKQKPLRAFYRIYILPQHIERREGEAKAVLEKELAEHLAFVEENGLQAELQKYLDAQKARQAAYDSLREWEGKQAYLKGVNIHDYPEGPLSYAQQLQEAIDQVAQAKATFEELKGKFTRDWH